MDHLHSDGSRPSEIVTPASEIGLRERFAKFLIGIGYRLLPSRSIAGVVVNPRGKWQAVRL